MEFFSWLIGEPETATAIVDVCVGECDTVSDSDIEAVILSGCDAVLRSVSAMTFVPRPQSLMLSEMPFLALVLALGPALCFSTCDC